MQDTEADRHRLRSLLPVLGIGLIEVLLIRSMQNAGDFLPLLGPTSLLSRMPASNLWAGGFIHNLIRVSLAFGLLWFLFFGTRLYEARRRLTDFPAKPLLRTTILLLHIASIGFLAYIRAEMTGISVAGVIIPEPWLSACYLVGFVVLVGTALCWIAPPALWHDHVRRHPIPAAGAAAACVALALAISLGMSLTSIEDNFDRGLFAVTAEGVRTLLRSWGYAVQTDVASRELSVDHFSVLVSPHCLGYEGAAIAVAGLSGYLLIGRRHLRFPQVFVIFPLAVAALFCANCLRIATLMAIGASWSSSIAVYGFHSAAGWINLLLIIGLSLLLIETLPFFSRRPSIPSIHLDEGGYQLLPQVVLLALALVTLLFSPGFDWLYPVRVFVIGALLFATRHHLGLAKVSDWALSCSAGLLVFLLWIALVGQDHTKSALFAATLFSAPHWVSIAWLGFRVLGAAVVVPMAEELAFRGYLLTACQKLFASGTMMMPRPSAATALALVVTSIGFGLLHSDWIAGTLAGLVYGAVKLRTNSIANAVIAHGVTNLALALFVLISHAWSLW